MRNRPIRAKSWNEERYGPAPPHVFLPQHLTDVYASAQGVLDATADDQLLALGLPPQEYRSRLNRCVLLAATLHDLGKANDHFQGMIYYRRNLKENPQGLRHEWVTLLMLRYLKDWLSPAMADSIADFPFVEWAVVGHHPGFGHDSPPRSSPGGAGTDIELLMGERDFIAALEVIQSAFCLGTPPYVGNTKRDLVGTNSVFVEITKWSRDNQRIWDKASKSADRKLVCAIKSSLIAADLAGSILPPVIREKQIRRNWIADSFAARPVSDDLQLIVEERRKTFSDLSKDRDCFQRAVAESCSQVTFVKAGCGSGKTQAAYMWAAENHPNRRLYFCYPTTGTSTEGFKDYLFDDVEKTALAGAQLFHSRRDVDFEIILEAGNDLYCPGDDLTHRLEALESWMTPIVACTVDTVLGLVQNNRRGLFAWPALAQSAFVFDEIHAFDDRLFGALLRFLQDLPGLPVLLMTASLSTAREKALRATIEAGAQVFSAIDGPSDLENRPRYRKEFLTTNDPMPAIRRTINMGGKVLWVCNTVARVMDAAAHSAEFTPLLYHSRFKYEHRVARHKAVVDAFNPRINTGHTLAICSQVAEMSLDLSADLLVTDLAPVPALIQRLGRLNRRAAKGDVPKPFVVVEPDGCRPYGSTDFESSRQWLARLPDCDISQRQLTTAWEQSDDNPPEYVECAWLDGGPFTRVSELRQGSPGLSFVMEEDLSKVRRNSRALLRTVLTMPPVPNHLKWETWPRECGIPIAPNHAIKYDELRGAEWQKSE